LAILFATELEIISMSETPVILPRKVWIQSRKIGRITQQKQEKQEKQQQHQQQQQPQPQQQQPKPQPQQQQHD
jgi:hypothetical protein